MDTQTCSSCHVQKPLEAFDRRRRTEDERIKTCKDCERRKRQAKASKRSVVRKRCYRCGAVKDATEFHRNASTRDGLQAACKPCSADIQREYAARHADLIALRNAKKLLEPISLTRTKVCKICGEEKPLLEFWANRGTKDRRAIYCKPCSREYDRKRRAEDNEKNLAYQRAYREANREQRRELMRTWNLRIYGLTPDQYLDMYDAQGGTCKICDAPGESFGGRRLHVDHDHESGRVRGLLCGLCNSALGKFKDSPDLLRRAASYLEVTT